MVSLRFEPLLTRFVDEEKRSPATVMRVRRAVQVGMAALGSPDSFNGSLSRLNARVVRALLRAMMKLIAGLLVALSTVPLAAQPTPGRLQPTPAALEIFQRDWVLMNWALK